MTPHTPTHGQANDARSHVTAGVETTHFAQGQWRWLFCLFALGLATTNGCTLSPGYDLPSVTTEDGGFTDTDESTGSPIAGTGGSHAAPSGGAPGQGAGGSGGEACSDAPGGEGGMSPVTTYIECGGAAE